MNLAQEALTYWIAVKKYRESVTECGRAYVAHVELPEVFHQVSNPKIIGQLSIIFSRENVNVAEA